MSSDFETDTLFQEVLDWIEESVREQVEPLDFVSRRIISSYQPTPGLFPTGRLPTLCDQAISHYAEALEAQLVEL